MAFKLIKLVDNGEAISSKDKGSRGASTPATGPRADASPAAMQSPASKAANLSMPQVSVSLRAKAGLHEATVGIGTYSLADSNFSNSIVEFAWSQKSLCAALTSLIKLRLSCENT
jgi:hypothetical protein